MERSSKEIILFAVTCVGVYGAVWAILLTNICLGIAALAIIAVGLGGFSCAAKHQQ
jgi:hypothetical protein